MLKITIEVKEKEMKAGAALCDCSAQMEGHASRPEIISVTKALASCMATLVKAAPDLSGALYDHFAEALEKELGVDDK